MPRKYPAGSESRLSREGLRGASIGNKTVKDIWAHAEKRRMRTVKFTDGTEQNMRITTLVDKLIKTKGYDDDE